MPLTETEHLIIELSPYSRLQHCEICGADLTRKPAIPIRVEHPTRGSWTGWVCATPCDPPYTGQVDIYL